MTLGAFQSAVRYSGSRICRRHARGRTPAFGDIRTHGFFVIRRLTRSTSPPALSELISQVRDRARSHRTDTVEKTVEALQV